MFENKKVPQCNQPQTVRDEYDTLEGIAQQLYDRISYL